MLKNILSTRRPSPCSKKKFIYFLNARAAAVYIKKNSINLASHGSRILRNSFPGLPLGAARRSPFGAPFRPLGPIKNAIASAYFPQRPNYSSQRQLTVSPILEIQYDNFNWGRPSLAAAQTPTHSSMPSAINPGWMSCSSRAFGCYYSLRKRSFFGHLAIATTYLPSGDFTLSLRIPPHQSHCYYLWFISSVGGFYFSAHSASSN